MTGNVPIEVDEVAHAAVLDGILEAMRFDGLDDDEKHAVVSSELIYRLHSDCAVFLYLLDTAHIDRPFGRDVQARAKALVYSEPRSAGNDLWFSRSGSGSGFDDGDWGKPGENEIGDYLTWLARLIPQVEVYVGDDGCVYGTF